MAKAGKHKSKMGYRDDSPYREEPYIDINTPDGTIDMSKTGTPLLANGKYLPPYSGVHQFNTTTVREIPMRQQGGHAFTSGDPGRMWDKGRQIATYIPGPQQPFMKTFHAIGSAGEAAGLGEFFDPFGQKLDYLKKDPETGKRDWKGIGASMIGGPLGSFIYNRTGERGEKRRAERQARRDARKGQNAVDLATGAAQNSFQNNSLSNDLAGKAQGASVQFKGMPGSKVQYSPGSDINLGFGKLDPNTDYTIGMDPGARNFVYADGGYLPQYGIGSWLKNTGKKAKRWLQTGDADGDGKRSGISNLLWKGADAVTETAGNVARFADPLNIGYGKALRRGAGNLIGDDRHQRGLDQATDFTGNIVGGAAKGALNAIPGGSIVTGLGSKIGGHTNNLFGNPAQEYAGQNKWEGYGNALGQVAGATGVGILSGGTMLPGAIGSGLKGAATAMETAGQDEWGRSRGTHWDTAAGLTNLGGSITGMFGGGDMSGLISGLGGLGQAGSALGTAGTAAGLGLANYGQFMGGAGQLAGVLGGFGGGFIPQAQNNQYGYSYDYNRSYNPTGYQNGGYINPYLQQGGYLPEYGIGGFFKKVGSGISNTAKKIGSGVKNFFSDGYTDVDGGVGVPFEGPIQENEQEAEQAAAEQEAAAKAEEVKREQKQIQLYNPYANDKYGYSGMRPTGGDAGSSLTGYQADMTRMPYGNLYQQGGSLQQIHPEAEYEVESGEVMYHPNDKPRVLDAGGLTQNSADFSHVTGNKHSDPEGGPQMAGGRGGYVLSDDPQMQVPDELYNEIMNLV